MEEEDEENSVSSSSKIDGHLKYALHEFPSGPSGELWNDLCLHGIHFNRATMQHLINSLCENNGYVYAEPVRRLMLDNFDDGYDEEENRTTVFDDKSIGLLQCVCANNELPETLQAVEFHDLNLPDGQYEKLLSAFHCSKTIKKLLLGDTTHGDIDGTMVGNLLHRNQDLSELELCSDRVNATFIRAWLQAVWQGPCPRLQSLKLQNTFHDDVNESHLRILLESMPNLTELSLNPDVPYETIAYALRGCPQLESLDLSHDGVVGCDVEWSPNCGSFPKSPKRCRRDVRHIAPAIIKLRSLKKLSLLGWQDGVTDIISSLRSCITTVNLGMTDLPPSALAFLADFLNGTGRYLEELHLNSNYSLFGGGQANSGHQELFFDSIANHKHMHHLNVECCGLNGWASFVSCIQQNTTLLCLESDSNHKLENFIRLNIADSLRRRPQLETFDASQYPAMSGMGPGCAQKMAPAFSSLPYLKTLTLRYCDMAEGANAILSNLTASSGIKTLDLGFNDLPPTTLAFLTTFLNGSGHCLEELILVGNQYLFLEASNQGPFFDAIANHKHIQHLVVMFCGMDDEDLLESAVLKNTSLISIDRMEKAKDIRCRKLMPLVQAFTTTVDPTEVPPGLWRMALGICAPRVNPPPIFCLVRKMAEMDVFAFERKLAL